MPQAVFISAIEPNGLAPLRAALLATVLARTPVVDLRIPMENGRLLAQIYREAEVVERRSVGDSLVLRVRSTPEAIGRLTGAGAVALRDGAGASAP